MRVFELVDVEEETVLFQRAAHFGGLQLGGEFAGFDRERRGGAGDLSRHRGGGDHPERLPRVASGADAAPRRQHAAEVARNERAVGGLPDLATASERPSLRASSLWVIFLSLRIMSILSIILADSTTSSLTAGDTDETLSLNQSCLFFM